MRYAIIILFILNLATSCNHEAELAMPEEKEYIVYNHSLQCRPLETDNGFYAISLVDSVPWLINIEPSGELNQLVNLSTYFPSDITYDSIANLNASHMSKENIMVAFTFYTSENSESTVQVLELNQQGVILDEMQHAIPSYNDTVFEFTAVTKNEWGEWLLVSSYTEKGFGPEANLTSFLQTSVFTKTDDGYEVQSTVETYSDLIISDAYSLVNGNIAILLSENQPPEQMSNGQSYTLLKISPDGSSNIITFEDAYNGIEIIKQVDGELLVVASLSMSADESVIQIMALSDANSILWSTNCTTESSFRPTCIVIEDNEFILGGLNGDTRDFNWNNVYAQTNTSLSMCAFSYDGQYVWNKYEETEFASLIVGVCQNNEGYTWLISKKSYDFYNNLAVQKTDYTGNIKQ